jgi:hypothetical protein
MRIVFAFAALLCFITSYSQTYLGNSVDPVLLETATRLMERSNETRTALEETEKGTYYLSSQFRPATVILTTNKKYKNVNSRYDALHDVLEIQHEGRVYVLEGRKINSVVINPAQSDSIQMIHARFVETENKVGLYEIIVQGKKSLLKKTEVFVKKPDYVVQFNAGSKVTTYSLIPKYYIWNEDKTAVPLKSTRKGIISALGSHKEEIDAYLDRSGGKISDEETLKGVFTYYNSL